MKIRSITSFFNPGQASSSSLNVLAKFSRDLQSRMNDAGFEVESTRLAASPFASWLQGSLSKKIETLKNLETEVCSAGWQYLSIGPATTDQLELYAEIPDFLAASEHVFCSAIIADRQMVYPQAAAAAASIIKNVSSLSPNGFDNLRFAALANVPPHAPFFPAAYQAENHPITFSLAMECADEAVHAFSDAPDLERAGRQFLQVLEEKSAILEPLCQQLATQYQIVFAGFDFSPAPFPEDWCSLGKAFELLGLSQIGGFGSLSAAAFIANTLDHGCWPKVGFNGLMLAVMEDSVLASRAATGVLSLTDLLLYSAVCGTGLDTIPLPGDVDQDDLTAVLLDLGALATRLDKPLTARLMPIPGKKAGDSTEFNFGYFANSRVMELKAQKVLPPLGSAKAIALQPRTRH